MTFEEKFPSLKNKEKYFSETWTDEYFNANDIIGHCLDKAKVLEAIDSINMGVWQDVLKETLGLSEDMRGL